MKSNLVFDLSVAETGVAEEGGGTFSRCKVDIICRAYPVNACSQTSEMPGASHTYLTADKER